MPEGFEYLRPAGVHPDFYDYRWEDGWELLWMNMGYYPDGHAINDPAVGSYYDNHNWNYEPLPSNAPYFAIYNRYRGILRLFANVWYSAESTFEDIDVTLRFSFESEEESRLTGLLRHASAYDRPLSDPTEIKSIHAPRFHAPDLTQWIVADFQMGYDPCSCMSTGELIFEFASFSTLNVDIIGRSIALDVPINDTTYTTRDFLNMSEVNVGEYVPGTEIYQNMDSLAKQFEKAQLKYLDDLEAYNQSSPFAKALQKFGIKQVGKYLSGGLANILVSDSLLTWVTNDNWQDATSLEDLTIGIEPEVVKNKFADKAKGLIGETFGFLATELFQPVELTKPSPPAVPVATLEESVYKGTIVNTDSRLSAPMVIPGSIPQAWEPSTPLSPHRLPVYNEVLGLDALLNKPIPFTDWLTYLNSNLEYIIGEDDYETSFEFQFRFENSPEIALNPALDIDFEKTTTYVYLELLMERSSNPGGNDNYEVVISEQSNLKLLNALDKGHFTELKLGSSWIPLEELNQYVYSIDVMETITNPIAGFQSAYKYKLKSLKMKLMHDVTFDQIGTSNAQVNTMHIRSYPLFSFNDDPIEIDDFGSNPEGTLDQYIPGLITLGFETITTGHPFVYEVIGNEIFINAQEVLINGPLQVQTGYTLVIQALEQIHQTADAVFNPKIQMRIKKDFYDTPVFEYADNTQIQNFCGSTLYQANVDAASISVTPPNQGESDEFLSSQEIFNRGSVTLYPNPARDLLTFRSSRLDMSTITIHDLSGHPIKQENLPDQTRYYQMDLSGIAPGTYIVRVDCGEEVFSKKLVVAR